MSKKYNIQEEPTSMVEEPAVAYNVRPSHRTQVDSRPSHLLATPPNAHTSEEMHVILAERIRRAEAGEEELVPNQVVFDSIHTKYGF